MGASAVDKSDMRTPPTAEAVAQPSGQFEAAGAAAHDDDTMLRQNIAPQSGRRL
jgi:hypothetical protein